MILMFITVCCNIDCILRMIHKIINILSMPLSFFFNSHFFPFVSFVYSVIKYVIIIINESNMFCAKAKLLFDIFQWLTRVNRVIEKSFIFSVRFPCINVTKIYGVLEI